MWRNYIKIALRGFAKHKLTFFINLFGLSLGLTTAIVIGLWVQDELAMDRVFDDSDRIYRVIGHQNYGTNIMTFANTPGILARELKNVYPEVEYAIAHTWPIQSLFTVEDKGLKYFGMHAEKDFFKVLSHEFLHGNAETALQGRDNVVITESVAIALFGKTEVVGESVLIDKGNNYVIGGVLKDISAKSSHKFSYVINMERFFDDNQWTHQWGNNGPYTLLKLREGADGNHFSDQIAGFIKERNEGSIVDLFAVPYHEYYLYGKYSKGVQSGGRIEYVRMFSLIGFFVLLIACINFMNLATARSQKRAREVGVRKVVGADRNSLIGQFISESVLLTLFACLLAILFVELIMPSFNQLTAKSIAIDYTNPQFYLMLLGVVLFTGLVAGSYPSFYLSSIKVVNVFKSQLKASKGVNYARKGLVVFQFITATVLILGTLVIYKQIDYLLNKDLGYDKDQLISYRLDGNMEGERFEAFRNELLTNPNVLGVGRAANYLMSRNSNTGDVNWEGSDPDASVLFEVIRVDYDFIPTIGLQLIEGRGFSRDFVADSTLRVVINRAARETMSNDDGPVDNFRLWGRDWQVQGVVENFHFESLHNTVEPAILILDPTNTYAGFIKISNEDVAPTLQFITEKAKEANPDFPFEYSFMDDNLSKLYASDERVRELAKYFALLTILISCLGLFGLSAYVAEQKTKEIGIRKVLGASTASVLHIINKEFISIVAVSILIGSLLGYYAMNNWLADYAFRVDFEWWYVALAASVIMLIAYATVSMQAYKATRINPVDTLKNE